MCSKKRLLLLLIILSITFYGCSENNLYPQSVAKDDVSQSSGEMRGMWVSYLELLSFSEVKDSEQFTEHIRKMCNDCDDLGVTDLFVQVRPFCDAIYPSELYPWSHVVSGEQGKAPGYDPLQIIIEEAHQKGIRIHAWINPYRLSLDPEFSFPKENLIFYDSSIPKKKLDNGWYLVPSAQTVTDCICMGVEELLDNYPQLDGIHMDDYFYPTTDPSFDEEFYEKYLADGGKSGLETFRRECISDMVYRVYHLIKEKDPTILFGISPQGNLSNNYSTQFADVKRWMGEIGYIDYICPQLYFGFEHEKFPFEDAVSEWNSIPRKDHVSLFIGITCAKFGQTDPFAGSGGEEWMQSDGTMLARMVRTVREKGVDGTVLFRYGLLTGYPNAEISAIIKSEYHHLAREWNSKERI